MESLIFGVLCGIFTLLSFILTVLHEINDKL